MQRTQRLRARCWPMPQLQARSRNPCIADGAAEGQAAAAPAAGRSHCQEHHATQSAAAAPWRWHRPTTGASWAACCSCCRAPLALDQLSCSHKGSRVAGGGAAAAAGPAAARAPCLVWRPWHSKTCCLPASASQQPPQQSTRQGTELSWEQGQQRTQAWQALQTAAAATHLHQREQPCRTQLAEVLATSCRSCRITRPMAAAPRNRQQHL